MPHLVVIPAGPGEAELARVEDLVAAIERHEPQKPAAILVIDDAPPRAWPHPVVAIANPRNGKGIGTLGGTTAATFAGLAYAHAHHPGHWVLRLDTDAAVIGPYAQRIESALQPDDGILGSCHVTCNGQRRDFSSIAEDVRRHRRAIWAFAHPPRRPVYLRPADPRTRSIIKRADANGYEPGEHCIAAACAITPQLIHAAHANGWLDDAGRYIHQRLGDDMLLGAVARAANLQLRDLTDVFGLQHVGLPDTPQNLKARGFALVHSTKGPDERAVRAELMR